MAVYITESPFAQAMVMHLMKQSTCNMIVAWQRFSSFSSQFVAICCTLLSARFGSEDSKVSVCMLASARSAPPPRFSSTITWFQLINFYCCRPCSERRDGSSWPRTGLARTRVAGPRGVFRCATYVLFPDYILTGSVHVSNSCTP